MLCDFAAIMAAVNTGMNATYASKACAMLSRSAIAFARFAAAIDAYQNAVLLTPVNAATCIV